MKRQCANCGKSIETNCTEEQCPNYYCSDGCAEFEYPDQPIIEIDNDKIDDKTKRLADAIKSAARIYKATK